MRIDAHQHFWRYSAKEYGWIDDRMAGLKRDFLPADLAPLLAATGFVGCVAVQARQTLEETNWLLDLAEQNDFVKGVVGWVDLCSPELPEQLERFAGHRKLKGVRHLVQDEPDDDFLLRHDFRMGVAKLAEYDLAYDLLLYPRHLPVAVQFVREFPEQRFVLDHIGKPQIADCLMEPWARDLNELAKFQNVHCKLSGMVTETRWKQWRAKDFRPFLDVVFAAFGTQRLMIGSDWPVCTLSGEYAVVMGAVIEYLNGLPTQGREMVLGRNCAQFYGIDGE
jgi:L-fuconolactonase